MRQIGTLDRYSGSSSSSSRERERESKQDALCQRDNGAAVQGVDGCWCYFIESFETARRDRRAMDNTSQLPDDSRDQDKVALPIVMLRR
jgi:hypothetical protein